MNSCPLSRVWYHSWFALVTAFAATAGAISAALPMATARGDDVSAVKVEVSKLPPAEAATVDFARRVEPLLTKRCVACHGPKKQRGGLRLDSRDAALAGGDNGVVIVPGKSAESVLVHLVAGLEPEKRMPPKGDPLTRDEIAALRGWIDQGARWSDNAGKGQSASASASEHWSFRVPVQGKPPAVKTPAWIRNPIDAYILAKLEAERVAPSPEADRTTQIRRLSLDLLGLPPTPAEVDAFVSDKRPDAYEQLVDRLLASPHFGERWGRRWLDLARYADSDGYEKDSPRPYAYRYRDWVIDAFNRDLPFDQFTIQQIAGDLLPRAGVLEKTATGFHRNTLTNREGGVDPEEFRVAAVVDRVNTTGTVWLGLTVGCAQCHTHKYDPILHREYYSMFAFFNSESEVDVPSPTPEEAAAYARSKADFDAAHAKLQAAFDLDDKSERAKRQAAWETDVAPGLDRPRVWTTLAPRELRSSGGARLTTKLDGAIASTDANPERDDLALVAESKLAHITCLRVEVLPDKKLPAGGPGRAPNGNFVLSEIELKVAPIAKPNAFRTVALVNPRADFSQPDWAVAGATDGNPATGWAVNGETGKRHAALFDLKQPIGDPQGVVLAITLKQQYGGQHTLGRFRIAVTEAVPPVNDDEIPGDVASIIKTPRAKRTAEQAARLASYHRTIDSTARKLKDALDAHAKAAPQPPKSVVPTLADNPQPPKTHIHLRGDFHRPGAEVQPGTLGVLNPLKSSGPAPTRLDLARWLVDPANPLTSRVAVNRVWAALFGRGIVNTPNDFGTRGDPPSHPELLDWLAVEFRNRGWSQKALIKLIVTSATYRQSSSHRPELTDRDANNVWLARQNRIRVEAEIMRDLALACSGLLSDRVGGPSARPPQPPGISDLTYAGSARWVESTGPDRFRRGMYTWFQRTSPYPMLMTFDAPDSNVCVVQRERSNSPLQALTMLNDVVFVECAQALARDLVSHEQGSREERLRALYKRCLGRAPSPDEIKVLTRLYDHFREQARAHPEAATKIVGTSAGMGAPTTRDVAETAAWVGLARAVMNLDEFMTRE